MRRAQLTRLMAFFGACALFLTTAGTPSGESQRAPEPQLTAAGAQMLANLKRRLADPSAPENQIPMPALCWAEGTPESALIAFAETANRPGGIASFQFNDGNR